MTGGGRWKKRCAPYNPGFLSTRSTTTARLLCSSEDRRQGSIPGGSVVGSPYLGVVWHTARSHAARLRLHLRFHAEHRELHRHVVRLLRLLRSDQHSVHRCDRLACRERSGDVLSPSSRSGNAMDADSGQHPAYPSSRRNVRSGPRGPYLAAFRKPTVGLRRLHPLQPVHQKRSFAAPNDPESRLAAANFGHRHGRRRSRPFFRSLVALTVSTCTYRAVGRPPVSNCGVGPHARSPPVRLPAMILRSMAPRTARRDRVPRA